MKILTVGGMHGMEPLGVDLVGLLKKKPIQNTDAVIGSPRAVDEGSRFIKTDLNRCFPGDVESEDYETRRAAELTVMTANYDIVLDFHNTGCPGNDCGFVGETADPRLYKVLAWLGLKRVIIADYNCINKFAPKCLSVEISLDSPLMDAGWWYKRLTELAMLETIELSQDIETYRFVKRMTLEDGDRLQLPKKELKAFQPIDKGLATKLGVETPAYPIFIADPLTPYNYGGLLNKI
jgi:hypothetical protein